MMYIIVRARNCEEYIEKCLMSLERQSYKKFHVILVLDAPEDDTFRNARPCLGVNRTIYTHKKRMGLGYNIWYGINKIEDPKDEDIICFLDGDDYLAKRALRTVKNYYKAFKCLATYGSYIKLSKQRKTRVSRPYKWNAKVRTAPWHGSHFKTFKYKVWKHFPKEYLMVDDKFVDAASDLALMFTIMEIAGLENCKHIPEATYYWRDNYKGSTSSKLQKKMEKAIRKKIPLARKF